MAFSFRLNAAVVVLVLLVAICTPVFAVDLLTGGIVVDAESGSVVTDATVVVFNDKGDVIASDTTDSDGAWQLELGWKDTRLIEPSHGKGLISSIFGVVMWPIQTTARVVGRPVKSVLKGAARAAGGAAVAGAGVSAVAGAGPAAIAAVGHVGRTIGQAATTSVVGAPDPDPDGTTGHQVSKNAPTGQVSLRVWKSGLKEFRGVSRVYSLDRVKLEDQKEYQVATVDPVKLATEQSALDSVAPAEFGMFRHVSADPAITLANTAVRIQAEIILPEAIESTVVIQVRDLTSKQKTYLSHTSGNLWVGELKIPRKTAYRNHDISVVAYKSPKWDGNRDEKLEEALWDKGAWDITKPFPVDPAVVACRNRGYVVVTVIRPDKN